MGHRSQTEAALTAHLVRPGHTADTRFLAEICRVLHDRYGIEHVTIQVEQDDRDHPCRSAPADVVQGTGSGDSLRRDE